MAKRTTPKMVTNSCSLKFCLAYCNTGNLNQFNCKSNVAMFFQHGANSTIFFMRKMNCFFNFLSIFGCCINSVKHFNGFEHFWMFSCLFSRCTYVQLRISHPHFINDAQYINPTARPAKIPINSISKTDFCWLTSGNLGKSNI